MGLLLVTTQQQRGHARARFVPTENIYILSSTFPFVLFCRIHRILYPPSKLLCSLAGVASGVARQQGDYGEERSPQQGREGEAREGQGRFIQIIFCCSQFEYELYRVIHTVRHMGWVDFGLGIPQ